MFNHQVEEEFQLKREREKKRLKQQLKIYQAQQGGGRDSPLTSRSVPHESPQQNSTLTDNVTECNGEFARLHKTTNKSFDESQLFDLSNDYQSQKLPSHSEFSRSYSNDSSKEHPTNGNHFQPTNGSHYLSSNDHYLPTTGDYPHKKYHPSSELHLSPRSRVCLPYNGDETRSSTG